MNNKNEAVILQLIKYIPPIFIITLSLIISISLYFNSQKTFKEEKNQIEKEYIQTNKELVRSEVTNVYEYVISQQKSTEKKLKDTIKERVYEAYKIAMNIYNQNRHLDKESLEKLIVDAIRTIRFNNERGYFFIYTMSGKNILNAGFPAIEGKELWDYKDAKGVLLIQEMNKILRNNSETFYNWYWHKPDSKKKKEFKKVGFFKKIGPFNWFIGTGEYIEDFENDIKKDVLEHVQKLKYRKRGYMFVIDYKGNYLSHIKKNIIGVNALIANDTRKHQTILDVINLAKSQKSGYITYVQNKKPGSNQPTKKTSFVKNVENWQWIIGKGFYEDETNQIIQNKKDLMDKRLKENLNDLIFMSSLLTLILLLISIYISKILRRSFKNYQNEISSNLKKITKQHSILAQQSKMAAIGEMIANIAHQWRQPLSMISTASTGLQLKKEVGSLSDEEFNKSLNYINDSTQYLSKTIDDFRNFFSDSKEKTEFDITSVIDETLNIISTQFKDKNINIIQNLSDTKVIGVRNELVQVLINILNNARDELIKIENIDKLIIIESFEENKILTINIKDNANGIKKDVLKHVFEPYFTTKHKSQGTGIGLYMAQEIIVKHFQGSINISNTNFKYEDKSYKGALITIKLNIADTNN